MAGIESQSHVTLHYRMAVIIDGEERELVNTFGAAPATLQMGVGQWAPGIEALLLGLDEGQQLDLQLTAAAAYGVHRPELVRAMARSRLRPAAAGAEPSLEAGAAVEVGDPGDGRPPLRGTLHHDDGETAWVDFNHPLAGRDLHLRVQVIGIL